MTGGQTTMAHDAASMNALLAKQKAAHGLEAAPRGTTHAVPVP